MKNIDAYDSQTIKQVLTCLSQRWNRIYPFVSHLEDPRGRGAVLLIPAGSCLTHQLAHNDDQPEAEEAVTFKT